MRTIIFGNWGAYECPNCFTITELDYDSFDENEDIPEEVITKCENCGIRLKLILTPEILVEAEEYRLSRCRNKNYGGADGDV